MATNIEPDAGPRQSRPWQRVYGARRRPAFSHSSVVPRRVRGSCRYIADAHRRRTLRNWEWHRRRGPPRQWHCRGHAENASSASMVNGVSARFVSVYLLLWLAKTPARPSRPSPLSALYLPQHLPVLPTCTARTTFLTLNMEATSSRIAALLDHFDELLAPPRPLSPYSTERSLFDYQYEEGVYAPRQRAVPTSQEVVQEELAGNIRERVSASNSFRSRSPTPFEDLLAEAYREIDALSPAPSRPESPCVLGESDLPGPEVSGACSSPASSGSRTGDVGVDEDDNDVEAQDAGLVTVIHESSTVSCGVPISPQSVAPSEDPQPSLDQSHSAALLDAPSPLRARRSTRLTKRKHTPANEVQEGKENLPRLPESFDDTISRQASPSRPRKRRKVAHGEHEELQSAPTPPQAGPSTGAQQCRLGHGTERCEYQVTGHYEKDWDHLNKEHGEQNTDNLFACTYPGCTGFSTPGKSGYKYKQSLNRHIMSKHWEGEVQCPWSGCEKVYAREDQVTLHIRRTHEKKPATKRKRNAPAKRTKASGKRTKK